MAAQTLPDVVEYFEAWGFEFRVEEPPDAAPFAVLVPETGRLALRPFVAQFVADYGRPLLAWLNARERLSRETCVGGPLDGKRHHSCPGDIVYAHVARADWAIYIVARDWSATYLGRARSKRKGRALGVEAWRKIFDRSTPDA
jgi:hypothetical protein